MRSERSEKRWRWRKKRKDMRREGTGTERPHGGAWSRSHSGGYSTHPEKNADLPEFSPESAHLLLQGVYGDFPHHNNESHMDRGITEDAAWQHCWQRLAAPSVS